MAGTTCPQAGGLARQSSSPASLHCSIDFVIRTSILLRMVLGRAIATPRGLPFPFRQLHRSPVMRSEEHTSELQSLMRISYAVFCLKKKKITKNMLSRNNQIDHYTMIVKAIYTTQY